MHQVLYSGSVVCLFTHHVLNIMGIVMPTSLNDIDIKKNNIIINLVVGTKFFKYISSEFIS